MTAIVAHTGMAKRQVQNAIGGMAADGFIRAIGRTRWGRWYAPCEDKTRDKPATFTRKCLQCRQEFEAESRYLFLCPTHRTDAANDCSLAI